MSLEESEERHAATGRNDPCPCGSGKKYKKCHRAEDEDVVHAALKKREDEAAAALAAEKENEEQNSKESDEKAKSPRRPAPAQAQASNKEQRQNVQPKNMPRRGAV